MAHATWIKKVKDTIRQKDSNIADVVLSQGGRGLEVQVDYEYKFPSAGRRYASAQGTQNCPKALREEVLLRGVEDWDMRNAMVSLVCQILPLCGPCDAWTARSQQVRRRSRVNEAMGGTQTSGLMPKASYSQSFTGKTPPQVLNEAFRDWLKERWGPTLSIERVSTFCHKVHCHAKPAVL